MNLKIGHHAKFIEADVKQGTVVAYLVKTSDLDIKSAVGRIAIKPFIEIVTEKIVFGAEDSVYGTNVPGFKQTVNAWLDYTNSKIVTNDMIFAKVARGLYSDSRSTLKPIILTKDKAIQSVVKKPLSIGDISNPSEALQLAAVSRNGDAIEYINNPSERVQLAAVTQNGYAIEYINNPSEALQLAAVKEDAYAIEYINNPSERVQTAAVNQDGRAIRYINNPSERVQLAAVNQYGIAIDHINNPSERVQTAAVNQDGRAIRFINDPSEAVQLAAKRQEGLK